MPLFNPSAGGVSDGDKGDITVSGSGATWNIDAGTVGLTELSATGTPSASNYLRGDNTWAAPAGGGDVVKVGTPVNNQVGVWTGDGTIEGDTALTFDTTTDTLSTVDLSLSNDLSLASGSVINFNAGDVTLTHASNNLTLAGGDLLISGTNKIRIGGADGTAFVDVIGATPSVQGLRIQGDGASALSFSTYVAADSYLRFVFNADGSMLWGDGTAVADVNLYRGGANILQTDDQIKLAAGTTTVAPLKFQAGTNLTTAEDGAIEMDGDCFYGTTDGGNRGVIPVEHIIRADATRTFTSNTSQQAIFTTPANGTLTLETGTYLFEGLIAMTSMSATSGNGKFSLIGAGTATLGAILWRATGQDAAAEAAAAAQGGGWHTIATQTAVNVVTAATGTALAFSVEGTFEVTGAGTIIPSFAQTTAAAAIVSIGSYIKFNRIGSTTMTSVGQWT